MQRLAILSIATLTAAISLFHSSSTAHEHPSAGIHTNNAKEAWYKKPVTKQKKPAVLLQVKTITAILFF
ncbi:MAG: hypothetical protein NVV59_09325 [Chitinophagaceae bacterium]|nr:hypothetical protein [Chitinophagaceae bacterium]